MNEAMRERGKCPVCGHQKYLRVDDRKMTQHEAPGGTRRDGPICAGTGEPAVRGTVRVIEAQGGPPVDT